MPPSPQRLSSKIVGALLLFLLGVLAVSGTTLYLSWQLDGGAAAINDAGSLRMRAYRIGSQMQQGLLSPEEFRDAVVVIQQEAEAFAEILTDLEQGDPARPLFLPRNRSAREGVAAVRKSWEEGLLPLAQSYRVADSLRARQVARYRYDEAVHDFVGLANGFVLGMERSHAAHTSLLRTLQGVLALLAIGGTALLVRYFFTLVIQPVGNLHDGIRRMADNDFSVRLPVETQDEIGGLASGFNAMAEHLQQVYGTLEERVEVETRNLAERNRDLAMLYEITAFLAEPASVEELSRGFLKRLRGALEADGGAVRLYGPGEAELFLMAQEGLSDEFLSRELSLHCGECLCGDTVNRGTSVAFDVAVPPNGMSLRNCVRAGFRTATAFTISHNKRILGVFNLYFEQQRAFGDQEIHLLETLGQHLGMAVENQRLKSREKELAVSEERNLLAQELHDSIAQGLAFLNIQAQLLRDSLTRGQVEEALGVAGQMREGIQESYENVRELLVHFRTRIGHADMDSALQAAFDKFHLQTGIPVHFTREGSSAPLAAEDQMQVLHIVQESLSNVRKHAQAREVRVKVVRNLSGVEVEIRDDGVGFDPERADLPEMDRHVGLKIMQERADRLGARLQVTSALGAGTCVTLTLSRSYKETA